MHCPAQDVKKIDTLYIHTKPSIYPSIYTNISCTGRPKIKSALERPLEIAIHGFKFCIFYVKREKFVPNHSRPYLGHPRRYAIIIKPNWTPQVLPGGRNAENQIS